ncbi:ABC transporter substrate-binding protein [Paenibacillus fonticola]|uniref:ABC transporter substrate-binding protein n=1 Tax=Paenibacillus fonticola TaxID=379896 RepID=UPI00036AAF3D|nr:extracellular solute-binding protein [Paenibacillus fonticola]
MMKWKRLQIVAVLLVATLLLAACGGGKGDNAGAKPSDNSSASNSASEKVKLRVMWWGSQPRHEATLKALELYTEKNPHVTFEPEYSGMDGYLDKLSTQAAAHNEPDIFQMDPGWISDWTSRNQLEELGSKIKLDEITPSLLPIGEKDGKQFAVPLGSVAFGMIYDKAALEKLGVTPPQDGWTWDDFFALAEEVKPKLAKDQYFTLDYAGNYFMFSAFHYAKGKDVLITDDGKFNIDEAAFLEWTKKFEQLRNEGLVPPADLNASDKEMDPTADLLVNGKVLFRYSFSNNYTTWDSMKEGAYDLVTMPRAEEAGGWLKPSMFLSLSPNSKHKEEAAKFIDWFVNDPEAGAILGTARGVPANAKIAESLIPNLPEGEKVGMKLIDATTPDGQTFTTGPEGWVNFIDKDWPLVRDELSFGRTTPEKAYESLKKASQEYEQ